MKKGLKRPGWIYKKKMDFMEFLKSPSWTAFLELWSLFGQVKFFPNGVKLLGHSDFVPIFSKMMEPGNPENFRGQLNSEQQHVMLFSYEFKGWSGCCQANSAEHPGCGDVKQQLTAATAACPSAAATAA